MIYFYDGENNKVNDELILTAVQAQLKFYEQISSNIFTIVTPFDKKDIPIGLKNLSTIAGEIKEDELPSLYYFDPALKNLNKFELDLDPKLVSPKLFAFWGMIKQAEGEMNAFKSQLAPLEGKDELTKEEMESVVNGKE